MNLPFTRSKTKIYSRHNRREFLLSNNQFTMSLIFFGTTNSIKNCGVSRTRTYDLRAMTLASYPLLHYAIFMRRAHVYSANISHVSHICVIKQHITLILQSTHALKNLFYHPLNRIKTAIKRILKRNITIKITCFL